MEVQENGGNRMDEWDYAGVWLSRKCLMRNFFPNRIDKLAKNTNVLQITVAMNFYTF